MKKRAGSALLTLAMLLMLFPVALAADGISADSRDPPETEQTELCETSVIGEVFIPDPDSLPDNEELFAAYVQREFEQEIGGGIATFGTAAGDRLSGLEKSIYTELKAKLEQVADGKESSTAFSITSDFSDLSWTAEELDCTIVSGGSITSEAKKAAGQKFAEAVDTKKLLSCLLADCPYELYWFDKTTGIRTGYSMSGDSTKISIIGITVSFTVASAYGSDYSDYTADTAKTGATSTAVSNAKTIVQNNARKTDREKLDAYREKICELVSYNDGAASDKSTPYGDPWQLIYVFDGDSYTNVVCEGYAKAFQYLCDLSTFSGDVTCFTVSGTMTGGTGSGGHMWNVVQMDGRNLLVDVTNCDTGSIGAPDKLFLVAVAGTDGGRTHTFTVNGTSVTFTYDEDEKDLFCDGYLALTPAAPGVVKLRFTAYDTTADTQVTLCQSGEAKYTRTCTATGTGGSKETEVQFTGVTAGTYDLVISKSGCLTYTVKGVVVPAEGLDLTSHSNAAISDITLLVGDVNGDGKINSTDTTLIRNPSNFNKSTSISGVSAVADINGDGTVNSTDTTIVRYSANFNKTAKEHCTINY